MTEIILHHYPQSPVAEKVRVGLGVKKLDWRSVEIPRMPPKPDLMPLTGGYRRTPVMQIGADIYCDSQCILREIDRRHPEPTFAPGGGQGMPWALSRWTDFTLFDQVVRVVLGYAADEMPQDLLEDRARLYFGPDCDMQAVKDSLPHTVAQLRAQFGWVNERLSYGRDFLLVEPGLPDILVYHLVWFLRGRWEGSADFMSEFPALEAWEARMKAIGHGQSTDMPSGEALEIAKNSEPQTPETSDSRDPQHLEPGMSVNVVPEGDGGDPMVSGIVHAVSRESIAILRSDDRVGRVCVHFPRVGYMVAKL